jgi:hypothetical protein
MQATDEKTGATESSIDLRRYISSQAAPGVAFQILLPGSIHIADGSWLEVKPNQVKFKGKGKVPNWIPHWGGKEFDVSIEITPLAGNRAKVSTTGAVTGTSEGPYTIESGGKEIRVDKLNLHRIKTVSLARWKEVETRASFFPIPTPAGDISVWMETWFVHRSVGDEGSAPDSAADDYPPSWVKDI